MTELFVLCGEASGDLQGSRLVRALKEEMPQLHLFGVAGPLLRELGVEPLIPMEEFQIMGFIEVVIALNRLRHQMRQVVDAILTRGPAGVLLIDYPGFNLRLAKRLRKGGYRGKIIQYISPKVWAWGKGRIGPLAKVLDLMLVIFPFEPDCYAGTGLDVRYIGNPLTALVSESRALQRAADPSLIGLFPGSRRSEIALNLPHMLRTVERLLADDPALTFALSVANPVVAPLIHKQLENSPLRSRIEIALPDQSYALMRRCCAALATSGTVNLELALHRVPTVVVYRMIFLNAFLAKCIFRINLPYYCIVNIVAGQGVYPELIQYQFTAKRAALELKQLISDPEKRERCLKGCEAVAEALNAMEAGRDGARLIREAVAASA